MGFLTFHRTTVPLHQQAQLEDRHGRLIAHIDPPSWRVVDRRRSSRLGMLVLAAAAGIAASYLMWTGYDATPVRPARPDAHASPQPEQTSPSRCAEPDGRVRGWSGKGTGGIVPHDWLHFLPKCDEGGRR